MIKRILFVIAILFAANNVAFAQDDYDDGPSTQKMQRQADKAKEKRMNKKEDPDKPLTERQARKAMYKRDRDSKKNYEEHHDRIQDEKVRKRMKKNDKRSKYINANKKPGKIKRLFMRSKRKR